MFHRIANLVKIHYRNIAVSIGNFEKVIDIFICLIYNDSDVIEALQFLLYICGIDILKTTMTDIVSPNILQRLFFKKDEIIANVESELTKNSQQWKSLEEKFKLYSAYLKKK